MKETELYWQVFNQAIRDYHIKDNIDTILMSRLTSATSCIAKIG